MKMVQQAGAALVVVASLAQGPAFAAAYNFDVLYFGGGVASLAPGSDNPTTTALLAGDSFDYKLTGQNGGAWTIVNSASFFPFFAFYVAEPDTRTGDFTLTLNRNGVSVFSYSEAGSMQSLVHLGTNVVSPPTGLVYDQYDLAYSLTSVLSGTGTSTPLSILPYPGSAPELNPFFPEEGGAITYSAPEPASAGLVLTGPLGFGFSRRRTGGPAQPQGKPVRLPAARAAANRWTASKRSAISSRIGGSAMPGCALSCRARCTSRFTANSGSARSF